MELYYDKHLNLDAFKLPTFTLVLLENQHGEINFSSLKWGIKHADVWDIPACWGVWRWTKTCVELVLFVLWWTVSMRWGGFAGFRWSVNHCGKRRGVPQTSSFPLFTSVWLINVVVGAEGPWRGWGALCDMWRVLQAAASLKVMGWDPGQRPKWEIHQECVPFLPLSVFGRTAAAITLLYISAFNLTCNTQSTHSDRRTDRQTGSSALRCEHEGVSLSGSLNIQVDT